MAAFSCSSSNSAVICKWHFLRGARLSSIGQWTDSFDSVKKRMRIYTTDFDVVVRHLQVLLGAQRQEQDPNMERLLELADRTRDHLNSVFKDGLAKYVEEQKLILNNEDSEGEEEDAEVRAANEGGGDDGAGEH